MLVEFILSNVFRIIAHIERKMFSTLKYRVVQSLSRIQLFVTPWTAAHQASLSFTISQSLLRFMSFESVMPSNYLILCHPFLLLPSIFPSIRVFSKESVLGQSIGASVSASVLPMSIQDWFPLGLNDLISLVKTLIALRTGGSKAHLTFILPGT